MSDLDDELLGLVDSGSEDEGDGGDEVQLTQAYEERSPSQEAKQSVEKTEEPAGNRRGVAQKVKSRGRRKRNQKSEDEDEVSPLRDASSEAPDIDEFDGDQDAPAEDDEDAALGYPVDGVYHSKEDRDHINSLPEVEREQILAERAEERERKRQDLVLKKALSANKPKRKASDAELSESTRRTTRPKMDKRSALDNYRRAREERGAERNRQDAARDRREERSPSYAASEKDADGESEVEWAAEPTSISRKDEPPAELKDFDRCRIGRTSFARVCFYPDFEKTAKGCFARVSVGPQAYRMAQIKGFTEGKPYPLQLPNGKQFTTDQYALVVQGKSEKSWPLNACSDGRFTDEDFDRYTRTLRSSNMTMPSKGFLTRKLEDVHRLLNTQFTEDTLHQKFAKQRAMELKFDPVHIAKQKRKAIHERRVEAEKNGDEEEIVRCDQELEALQNSNIAANGSSKPKSSPAKIMTQDRLAALNHANRAKNAQEVRQALIAERKKLLKEREAMHEKNKKQAEERAAAAAKASKFETNELFGETPNGSRAGTPASIPDKIKKTLTQNGAVKKGPVGALKQRTLDDDVIGGLDLDIDIEI